MTVKLYEGNALLRQCQAKVISCVKKETRFEVTLDKTIIFPEGGGQLSDEGKIDEAVVSHAVEADGEVIHYIDRPLKEGQEVTVTLNWAVRLDHMQQHTGEHILSYAFWKLCGANNIGFHMNPDIVTIDLDKEVTEEDIVRAENYANNEIWENKPITIEYLPHTEVAKLPMRKKNAKLTGILRVVTIQDGDICTCCGTHPPFTGVIGAIKVFRWEKHKGGTRVEFGCGVRALADAQRRYKAANEAGHILSVKVEAVPEVISNLKNEISNLSSRLKEKTAEVYALKLQEFLAQAPMTSKGYKVVCVTEETDSVGAKLLMQQLSEENDLLVAIFAHSGARINYQFAVTLGAAGDCRKYIAKANELFGGKGGGKPEFAQGGANYCGNWQILAQQVADYMQREE